MKDTGVVSCEAPVTDTAGLLTGASHVYVVPAGTVGTVAVNGKPEHIDEVSGVTIGTGLTGTVNVNELPTHVFAVGTMVYNALAAALVELVSVWLMVVVVNCALPPLILEIGVRVGGAAHE